MDDDFQKTRKALLLVEEIRRQQIAELSLVSQAQSVSGFFLHVFSPCPILFCLPAVGHVGLMA